MASPRTPLPFQPSARTTCPLVEQLQWHGFPSSLPTAYNYRYSLEIEHEFSYQWVFTLGYQGNTGHHFTRQYDENIVYGVAGAPLNPTTTQVNWNANNANSNYNAMLVGLRHGFTRWFQFEADYRWSKLMDNASQPYYQDPYMWIPAASWGPADYNVTNAFKAYGVWQSPWFLGKHNWEGQILGGWTLAGILNWHSGFPWTPVYNPGCIVVSTSSDCQLRPGNQIAGFSVDTSNSAFMSGPGNGPNSSASNSNFPNGGLGLFHQPCGANSAIPCCGSCAAGFTHHPQHLGRSSLLRRRCDLNQVIRSPAMPGIRRRRAASNSRQLLQSVQQPQLERKRAERTMERRYQ